MELYDAVIVGSGFGGSIPALRLAKSGRKVLVLEWGRRNTAKELKQKWGVRYYSTIYNAKASSEGDVIFRYGRTLGGGSVVFSGACLRAPSGIFDFVDDLGYKVWPDEINRKVLDPFYDDVENKMQISQIKWEEVPKPGAEFARMFFNIGKSCDRARFNYVDCIQCGFCEAGCIFDRKRSLLLNYIPEAENNGAEFRTDCFVKYISKSSYGYKVVYSKFGAENEVHSPLVVVAANAIESAAILLRSKEFLPNLSDQVGKNFSNNGDLAWFFLLPKPVEGMHLYMGRNNAGTISYAYCKPEYKYITMHAGCLPPGIFAALNIRRLSGEPSIPWGLKFKHFAKEVYMNRLIGVTGMGLVRGEGSITIDSLGNPIVNFPITPLFKNYIDDYYKVVKEIADGNNAEILAVSKNIFDIGGAHLLGSLRMAYTPEKGVCNPYGEVFGYRGLFVSDSSTIPGGTSVNPALTIAANADRIAKYIVDNYG